MMNNPYEVLALPENATPQEIKGAYRRLASRWHPDRAPTGQAEEFKTRFQAVKAAYETLSDPAKRAAVSTGSDIVSEETLKARAAQESDGPCPACAGTGRVRVVGGLTKDGRVAFWSTQACPKGCKS